MDLSVMSCRGSIKTAAKLLEAEKGKTVLIEKAPCIKDISDLYQKSVIFNEKHLT